jgi:WD40 repeat protein
MIASGLADRTVRLWDAARGTLRLILEGHGGSFNAVAFSPNGETLASASYGQINLWEAESGAHILRIVMAAWQQSSSVSFSPCCKRLASASKYGCEIWIWDTEHGNCQQTLGEFRILHVHAIAFSSNGATMAASSNDGIQLWDTATGASQKILQRPKGVDNTAVAFLPDGKTLASASSDHTITIWDLDSASGTHQQMLERHDAKLRNIVFSPDGTMLASSSDDGTLRIWDAVTGVCRQRPRGTRRFCSGARILARWQDASIVFTKRYDSRGLGCCKRSRKFADLVAFSLDSDAYRNDLPAAMCLLNETCR